MQSLQSIDQVVALFEPSRRGSLKHLKGTMRTQTASFRFEGELISESRIESMLHQCAEFAPFITSLRPQPFTTTVHWGDENFEYTPDALVCCSRGWCVAECKPSRIYFDVEEHHRLKGCAHHFEGFGLPFIVVDEHDVGGWGLQDNLARLWRVRRAVELDEEVEALVMRVAETHATISELCSEGFSRFSIDRALATQRAYTDLHNRLSSDTEITRACFGDPRDFLHKFSTAFTSAQLSRAPLLWECLQ